MNPLLEDFDHIPNDSPTDDPHAPADKTLWETRDPSLDIPVLSPTTTSYKFLPSGALPDSSRLPNLSGISNFVKHYRSTSQQKADMSELNFAKQFLTTIDAKPTKYQSNHVFDPKTFATRVPYVLPRLAHPPHPPPPRTTPSEKPPGAERVEPKSTIILKSTKNPILTLTLPDLPPASTTIAQLKASVQLALGGAGVVPMEKIKVLFNKKPVGASKKTVADAVDGADVGKEIEFGVMVMGGAKDPEPSSQPATPQVMTPAAGAAVEADPMEGVENAGEAEAVQSEPPTAPGEPSSKEVLGQKEFWDDLKGFLSQRLKDDGEASRLRDVFEGAWKAAP